MATPAKTSSAQATTNGAADTPKGEEPRTFEQVEQAPLTLTVPVVTGRISTAHIQLPGTAGVADAVRSARSLKPSPAVGLFYGALAATAAIGVIQWPVAAAIGVGTALARRAGAGAAPERHDTSA
jgi:hypothetical protein